MATGQDPEAQAIGRRRLSQVFEYLAALNSLRNPVKRLIQDQPWRLWLRDLPDHESVQRGAWDDEATLTVRLPRLTSCPQPPSEIAEWLEPGWDRTEGTVQVRQPPTPGDGDAHTVGFADDPRRPATLMDWKQQRERWVTTERPARRAAALYETLYELHGRMGREEDAVELMLGDGILDLSAVGQPPVHHPVLLQRLHREFHPEVPEFALLQTDDPPGLYTALFATIPDLDGEALGRCRTELEQGQFHPLGGEDTSGFLRSMVQRLWARGEFIVSGEPQGVVDHPRMGRDPVIFLRARTTGFATALESIGRDLQVRTDMAPWLLDIVGAERSPADHDEADGGSSPRLANEDEEVLLSKPANAEQLKIAQRLAQHGAVLVQGPPGTGKTHTIANLIGHFMSQGKNVLVTADTAKALRVLRGQIVEQLRPLAISVLGRDADSRADLEAAVNHITDRLTRSDGPELRELASSLARERGQLIERLQPLRKELQDALTSEYSEVVVAGRGFEPIEAAKIVAQGVGTNEWIPPPISLGEPSPLSAQELSKLYETNVRVTAQDEADLACPLPSPGHLLPPDEFEHFIEQERVLLQSDLNHGQDLWLDPWRILDAVEEKLDGLKKAVKSLADGPQWKLACIEAGQLGGPERIPWDELLKQIDETYQFVVSCRDVLLRHGPSIPADMDLDEAVQVLEEIIRHREARGGLGRVTLLLHPTWQRLLPRIGVGGRPPRTAEDFRAILLLARVRGARRALVARWERQMTPLGGPPGADLGHEPETACKRYGEEIAAWLVWHAKTWQPALDRLLRQGFLWTPFLSTVPPPQGRFGSLLQLRAAVETFLPPVLAALTRRGRLKQVQETLRELENYLADLAPAQDAGSVLRRLRAAVSERSASSYRQAHERLLELLRKRPVLEERKRLLAQLGKAAPGWAAAIRQRRPPHEAATVPGDPEAAWLWRQLHDELDQRARVSLDGIQTQIRRLAEELQQVTAQLIDAQAWAAQIGRVTPPQRRALFGWLEANQRIRGGTGKRVPQFKREARRRLAECRSAIPVWIMPLSRAVESFDAGTTRFDIVIIDEASQCDAMGLAALYMARQVLVVGDDQQVTPDAVGQRLEEVQHLIDSHLAGIPSAPLYDGQRSLYAIAQGSFGGTIRLLEHFRCVPEIIQFSNDLCYNGDLLPLRDGSGVATKPSLIAHRVDGTAENRVNREEALAIASLICAAVEQPEYAANEHGEPLSFGVISLVGDEQALEIERLLRRHLPPEEYERRRIVCGSSAHFQGDERHVMFLSVVDSAEKGPLALRSDDRFKKRFNVAASRARDQMWVVYSLNPDADLRPEDLRSRLIKHAVDPQALVRKLDRAEKLAESPFEKEVAQRLIREGHRLSQQYRVGHYRIDIVVEGGRKRLAVECDGDRAHPPEKLAEDLQRQAILERLGWTFERLRGSEFYRDRERTMGRLFERLRVMGIPAEGPDSNEAARQEPADELTQRVIRQAAALREAWGRDDSTDVRPPAARPPPRSSRPSPIAPAIGGATRPDQSAPPMPSRERAQAPKGAQRSSRATAGHLPTPTSTPNRPPEQIREQHPPQPGGQLPMPIGEAGGPSAPAGFDLLSHLRRLRLEISDKRSRGGALWVIGGPELDAPLRELRAKGARFTFAPRGSRSTRNRPAWWTK